MEINFHSSFVLSCHHTSLIFLFIEWFNFIVAKYLGVKCSNYILYLVIIFLLLLLRQNKLTHSFTHSQVVTNTSSD